jgi:non-homologous end joining protein Ku
MLTSWTGVIGFGLVTAPVSMAPAAAEHDVLPHQVHVKDGGPPGDQAVASMRATHKCWS